MELVERRRDVALVMAKHGLSERRVFKLLELNRTSCRYEPRPDGNAGLRQAMIESARQKPHYGYRRLGALLARRGWLANPKRVYRLYRQGHLAVRRLKRKRVQRIAPPLAMLTTPNPEWPIDFFSDSLIDGQELPGADDRGQLHARVPGHRGR
ncbi:MAG: IS3 family transposase [Bryobacterales bacterium]|nr:IS3 family transposase [Bryobacteraceae bacterium]MDW8356087.1 IS3 family transposase [Bryobacterales bacterium]